MNLDDLQRELHTRADGVRGPDVTGPGVTTSRLAGVRHRAQVVRRRRAAAGVAAAVMLIGAAAGVPKLPLLHETDAPPAKQVLTEFPPTYNGDPLVQREIGAFGAGSVILRFTPTDANIAVVSTCFIDQAVAAKYNEHVDGITTTITVNGNPISAGCKQGAFTEVYQDGQDPAANRRAWGKEGVKPGRESTVVFTYPGQTLHSVRLAVAVYQMSGRRIDFDGYRLPGEITFGGAAFGSPQAGVTALNGTVRSVSKPVRPGDLVCGVVYNPDPTANDLVLDPDQLTVSGADIVAQGPVGAKLDSDLLCSLVSSEPIDGTATGTYAAAAGSRGTIVIAVYSPTAT
ncbi:hypothetical protein ACIB24_03605 [Spongisporangium articulatum]|uniref:Uncharacterized protein n=1 Tax=Spongisporangium articulatum TaxID=3362603 RepID=A0ABW8AIF0_9ACTN